MADSITQANNVHTLWLQEINALEGLKRKASRAEVAYRIARAVAFDDAKGSVASRNMQADKVTAGASQLRYDTADDVDVQVEKLRRIRSLAELKRSEVVNDRTLSGMGT